ncbi:hypothetical protein [Sphingomonas sp.]|uniref:terminase small subunit-like protein n=1 Tax=Sphingomonas sp. TaxID=28214 RepID=UPI003B3AD8C5
MRDYSALLDALTEHGNLTKACRDLGIAKSTFLDAVDADSALADRYTQARARGFDTEAERGLEDALTWEGDAALGRLALDARKWYLSKLAPKRYGDKQLIGSDPENPLPAALDLSKLSPEQLKALASIPVDGKK